MSRVPDNYDIYDAHEAAEYRELKRLPTCASCGEPITSERAYNIEGDGWYCERCFKDWISDISTLTENLIDD